ncbi:MAG: LOG family protein, partial [Chitinophagales bacterium]
KVLLTKYSYGFVVMPGGVGTMDEFFETLTLIQTKTIQDFPLVVIGKEYYTDIMELLQKMQSNKTISPADMEYVLFTDDIEEAVEHIRKYMDSNFIVQHPKPQKLLLEKI